MRNVGKEVQLSLIRFVNLFGHRLDLYFLLFQNCVVPLFATEVQVNNHHKHGDEDEPDQENVFLFGLLFYFLIRSHSVQFLLRFQVLEFKLRFQAGEIFRLTYFAETVGDTLGSLQIFKRFLIIVLSAVSIAQLDCNIFFQ